MAHRRAKEAPPRPVGAGPEADPTSNRSRLSRRHLLDSRPLLLLTPVAIERLVLDGVRVGVVATARLCPRPADDVTRRNRWTARLDNNAIGNNRQLRCAGWRNGATAAPPSTDTNLESRERDVKRPSLGTIIRHHHGRAKGLRKRIPSPTAPHPGSGHYYVPEIFLITACADRFLGKTARQQWEYPTNFNLLQHSAQDHKVDQPAFTMPSAVRSRFLNTLAAFNMHDTHLVNCAWSIQMCL